MHEDRRRRRRQEHPEAAAAAAAAATFSSHMKVRRVSVLKVHNLERGT